MEKNKKWYAYYYASRGLTRAGKFLEPVLQSTKYNGNVNYDTEEEAKKEFSNGLKIHVNSILADTYSLCDNKLLKTRLRKYGNFKEIKKLESVMELLDSLDRL